MARALDGEAPMWNKGLASLGLLLLAVVVYAAVPTHGQNSGPPGRPAVPLPEGEGKATVQAACGICHSLRQVTNAGYDRAEWDTVLHMMVNVGAPLPPGKFDTVLNYLAAKFPPKPAPAAKLIPGPARVTITEWVVPTPGSRPHDPMYAPDGSVWYSGQMANVLGRFDPRTQTFKEDTLPPRSGRTGCSPTRTATCGIRRISPGTSASSIPGPAWSRSIRCRTPGPATRIRCCLTGPTVSFSRCRAGTWWGGWTCGPATSSS